MLRSLKAKGIHAITLALEEKLRSDDFTAAAVEGALLADLENDRYKTDPKKNEKHVDSFAVLGGSQAGVDRGRILAEAQNFTRDLANEPANVLTPLLLAERAVLGGLRNAKFFSLAELNAIFFFAISSMSIWMMARSVQWSSPIRFAGRRSLLARVT